MLYEYIIDGGVSTFEWNKVVSESVMKLEKTRFLSQAILHPSLQYAVPLSDRLQISNWWRLAGEEPSLRAQCRLIVSLLLGHVIGIDYTNNRNYR